MLTLCLYRDTASQTISSQAVPPVCRCVLHGPTGASDGQTKDGSQEACGG